MEARVFTSKKKRFCHGCKRDLLNGDRVLICREGDLMWCDDCVYSNNTYHAEQNMVWNLAKHEHEDVRGYLKYKEVV